ncbi:hypothetical protein NST84_08895 [Paenibacillus sp. FSL R7-0345]|uniref:hypothetical protein n=1 Tax=Paenibacillus sp. FSL R7-0345 TaxID=2954535 RepID=UPI00315A8A7D
MNEVLTFRNENGATIFETKNLSIYAKVRIIKEFNDEYPEQHIGMNAIKLINPKKSVLEISNNIISFFPSLSPEITEKHKKRIYKLIAQRSEIYISNSREKIELSTSRLLGKDLRASVSLLYYSLHNFTTGKMFQYLSEKIEVDEHAVYFNEVEHFTSEVFFNDIYRKHFNLSEFKVTDVNKENYSNVLSTTKKKGANPFKILPIVLFDTSITIANYINPYLYFLYKELFGKELTDDSINNIDDFIESAIKNRPREKGAKQEAEVKACIAFSYRSILDAKTEEESIIFSFFIIALRLYWLRQTADYDYDFEIKTSTREVSLLLNVIQQLYKQCELISFSKGEEKLSVDDIKPKPPKSESNKQVLDQPSKDIEKTYFDIDLKEAIHGLDCYLFMTALHLDGQFSYEDIIFTMNFTPNITNRLKYYIYELLDPLPIAVNVHLDKEGRWTIWVNENSAKHQIITENDLIDVFDHFSKSLFNNHRDFKNVDYTPKLCISFPKYTNKAKTHDSLKIETISSMNNSIIDRNAWIISTLLRDIAEKFEIESDFPYLYVDKCKIFFRLNFGYDQLLIGLPLYNQIYTESIKGNSNTFLLNLVIKESKNDSPRTENLEIMNIYKELSLSENSNFHNIIQGEFGISKAIANSGVITANMDSLNNYLLANNEELFYNFTQYLNQVSHELIENQSFRASKHFLDVCLKYDKCDSFAYATMGLWYFRNSCLDIEECEKQGKYFYELSIKNVIQDHPDDEHNLKQRYYYELARFYLQRKHDTDLYLNYYDMGSKMGKHYFYNHLQTLHQTFKETSATSQISSRKIRTSKAP